jgi:hypothetical protein
MDYMVAIKNVTISVDLVVQAIACPIMVIHAIIK